MKSTQTYTDITGRNVTDGTYAWLCELIERFGDDRVSIAIEDDAVTGKPFDKILSRVRDKLAREDAMHRPSSRTTPPEVAARGLMDIVRGLVAAPATFIYDTRHLTAEEYAEVLTWSSKRRGI